MPFQKDRASGFPVVPLPERCRNNGYSWVGLLPLTKIQLEKYIASGQAQRDKPGGVAQLLEQVHRLRVPAKTGGYYGFPDRVKRLRRVPTQELMRENLGSIAATALDWGEFPPNQADASPVEALQPKSWASYCVKWLQGELPPLEHLLQIHQYFQKLSTTELLHEALQALHLSDQVFLLLRKMSEITKEQETGLPLAGDFWEMTRFRKEFRQAAGINAGQFHYFPMALGNQNRYYPSLDDFQDQHVLLMPGFPAVSFRLLFSDTQGERYVVGLGMSFMFYEGG